MSAENKQKHKRVFLNITLYVCFHPPCCVMQCYMEGPKYYFDWKNVED